MGNPQTGSYTNIEDPDEMRHKIILRQKNTIFVEAFNLTRLDMYNRYPNFIVSNQKENPLVYKRQSNVSYSIQFI